MKALIFAAGIGSRLKPFTDSHPKALAEVGGRPLLQHVIERLRDVAYIREMTVNVHHFPAQIRDFLKANDDFGVELHISDESECLLDTGGGLLRAKSLIQPGPDEPILLHNADILTDFPVNEMIEYHRSSGNDVTLLAQQRSSSRVLYFHSNTLRLKGWQNLNNGKCLPAGFEPEGADCLRLAFGGVHIVQPSIFPALEKYASAHSPVFSTIPFYLDNLNSLRIGAFVPTCTYRWFDIGSPEKLLAARSEW